jgi:hypothetical protein
MSTSYYIFKTDNKSGKTIHICNGSHNDEHECRVHWLCYMYGFMDGAFELLGRKNFTMEVGTHDQSFRLVTTDQQKDVEYFMLLDKEGQDMVMETCRQNYPADVPVE